MKIKTVHIENFRSFRNECISLSKYACFVGPNGAGKSSVLAALNVFFGDQSSSTFDTKYLEDEDYFCMNTAEPIRITVKFDELSSVACEELSDYARQGELVVTAEAIFDRDEGYGHVKHYGQRLGFEEFRTFFEREKARALAAELGNIYDELRQQFTDLPNVRSKDDRANALRAYESNHREHCTLIPSEDSFYGINGTGKLAKFLTWIYVPAVKDASDESEEIKDTAFSKLLERTVRTRINFGDEINSLATETLGKYNDLLEKNRPALDEISNSLQKRLCNWAHPNVKLGMTWRSDPTKSVAIQQPIARIKTGEGEFLGSLNRMGHGLQRSYILALLQELADSDAPEAPTLILGCEEPELYQHPPQARHLADVFTDLAKGNNQIIITTHSPIFINGKGFENVRITRKINPNIETAVRGLCLANLCNSIRMATGEEPSQRTVGMVAKIHQALQPGIAEMFFARVPILVEGVEDVAYITTALHLSDQWLEFRQLGCHLIPVGGKSNIIQPLAISKELGLPVYIVFDADRNNTRINEHQRDNKAIQKLLGVDYDTFPADHVFGENHTIWSTNISDVVKADFGQNYQRITDGVRVHYDNEASLNKNDLFIAEWLTVAYNEDLRSPSLARLCNSILQFSRENVQ